MHLKSIPTDDQFRELLFNNDVAIQFCFQKGIFYNEKQCQKCNTPMALSEDKTRWRCSKYKCGYEISPKAGSFFYGAHLEIQKILNIGRKWLNKESTSSIVRSTGLSSRTVCTWIRYYRQLVADSLEEEDYQIGGDGIIVEIDESKVAKRKYNRGHRVDGAWVLGGVERTQERRVFLREIPDRKASTLMNILSKHILPGSIVYSDKFASYSQLGHLLNMAHFSVNHSKSYYDLYFEELDDGWVDVRKVHTNTIEGTWAGLKLAIPRQGRKPNLEERLFEFIWRRRHQNNLWESLIYALKDVHYD